MAIITLKELVLLNQERFSSLGNYPTSELSIQQQQFQLLVRQKRMGLNIEPLLDPQLASWLKQLESFVPGIFEPGKKIYLNTRWKAQIQLDPANYWLEVPINAGVVKNQVRLYEWRIGSIELNWRERVKLWVACRYLNYQPENLMLVICAFSPNHHGQINKIRWDKENDCATEKELKSVLNQEDKISKVGSISQTLHL